MAMLADRKQKQKLAPDPRNTFWSNNDDKFGQKLLEKMGWKKGKGLGANENGMTNFIKAQKKSDNRGVGCSTKLADKWIEHQDDFNALLTSLNEGSTPKEAKIGSLEEKSKSSRSRVHYQKFTRGKDLSLKSKEDLNCVFGNRKKTEEPTRSSESPEPVMNESVATSDFTYAAKLSVQDYFASKMKLLKAGLLQHKNDVKNEVADSESSISDNEKNPYDIPKKIRNKKSGVEFEKPQDEMDGQEIRKKKKKKKKKNEYQNDEIAETVEKEEGVYTKNNQMTDVLTKKLKTRKKKDTKTHSEDTEAVRIIKVDCDELTPVQDAIDNANKRKKKKSKKVDQNINGVKADSLQSDEHDNNCDRIVNYPVKERKDKKQDSKTIIDEKKTTCEDVKVDEESDTTYKNKVRRKKKCKRGIESTNDIVAVKVGVDKENEDCSKKKKSRLDKAVIEASKNKCKNETDNVTDMTVAGVEMNKTGEKTKQCKKSKKSKRKVSLDEIEQEMSTTNDVQDDINLPEQKVEQDIESANSDGKDNDYLEGLNKEISSAFCGSNLEEIYGYGTEDDTQINPELIKMRLLKTKNKVCHF